jgi:hypothetical protein
MSSENLKLWESVEATDPKYTKKVSFGRKFTAIDPTYQNKQATALWGPQGKAWGLRDLQFTTFESIGWDKEAKQEIRELNMMLQCVLFYPNGEIPVAHDTKFRAGDDTAKKLRTACRSKALAELGFNADVFMGEFDDDAYVNDAKIRFGSQTAFMDQARGAIATARDKATLDACEKRVQSMAAKKTITHEAAGVLMDEIEEARARVG